MPINKNELTKEMLQKAMQCKSADELIALAKTGGYEMTKEEAEAKAMELLERVGLADRAGAYPEQLSGVCPTASENTSGSLPEQVSLG